MSDAERPVPRSPAEVERNIDRTRGELTLTLDALERRLNPRDLMQKGFDMFEDSFIGREAVDRGLAAMRANPVPFALLGIGAAWLLASNMKAGTYATSKAGEYASDVGRRVGALATDVAGRVGVGSAAEHEQALGHTGNPVVDEAGRPQANGWVHHVAGFAQGALRTVRDAGGAAINRAGGYAGDGAGRLADRLNGAFQRHPLLLGSIAAMTGVLIASLLPLSRVEHEWVGGTRDDLWQRAEEFGQEAVSSARKAASRAVDAASETIKETIEEEIGKPASR